MEKNMPTTTSASRNESCRTSPQRNAWITPQENTLQVPYHLNPRSSERKLSLVSSGDCSIIDYGSWDKALGGHGSGASLVALDGEALEDDDHVVVHDEEGDADQHDGATRSETENGCSSDEQSPPPSTTAETKSVAKRQRESLRCGDCSQYAEAVASVKASGIGLTMKELLRQNSAAATEDVDDHE